MQGHACKSYLQLWILFSKKFNASIHISLSPLQKERLRKTPSIFASKWKSQDLTQLVLLREILLAG